MDANVKHCAVFLKVLTPVSRVKQGVLAPHYIAPRACFHVQPDPTCNM